MRELGILHAKVSLPSSLQVFFVCCGAATKRGSWPPHSWGFLDHIQRRTTVGRTPLDEWSARRRDLYLTTHNTHKRQTSIRPWWDSNPRSQQASGHWDRPSMRVTFLFYVSVIYRRRHLLQIQRLEQMNKLINMDHRWDELTGKNLSQCHSVKLLTSSHSIFFFN